MDKEPLIYNEQGVVYLFSKYWDKIFELQSEIDRIADTHTHFPDFEYYNHKNKLCGLEFKYKLSGFGLYKEKKLRELKGYNNFLGIYWIQDYTEKQLDKVKKRLNNLGMSSKFRCLKDFFMSVVINNEDKKLGCYWGLKNETKIKEAYSYDEIEDAIKELENNGLIKSISVNKKVYRTIGWNISSSDMIDPLHWQSIYFWTTKKSKFKESMIPIKLFIKPRDYKKIIGYFYINRCFKINNKVKKQNKKLGEFFRKYYFYDYNQKDHDYRDSICFVYKHFERLAGDKRGKKLFDFLLKNKISLKNQSSELIEDSSLIEEINAILESNRS